MFSLLFSAFSALLLALSITVNAAPLKPVEYVAYAPQITSPQSGVTWYTGSTQTVSWSITNIPQEAQNYTVIILLGYLQNNSENLDMQNPLASQIPIMSGSAQITVPTGVSYGNNYVVAVIGDSGDISETFTIQNATGLSGLL